MDFKALLQNIIAPVVTGAIVGTMMIGIENRSEDSRSFVSNVQKMEKMVDRLNYQLSNIEENYARKKVIDIILYRLDKNEAVDETQESRIANNRDLINQLKIKRNAVWRIPFRYPERFNLRNYQAAIDAGSDAIAIEASINDSNNVEDTYDQTLFKKNKENKPF